MEPPPTALMDRGFVTPASLHYVRNHGPVPKLTWKDHRLTVKGLGGISRTFSMDEIAAMPQASILSSLTFQASCFQQRSRSCPHI